MLALAGYPLGLEFRFFDANQVSPARSLGEFINASFDDRSALEQFAKGVDLVTTEFENINTEALAVVEQHVRFYPGSNAVAMSQDRLTEKNFFNGLGIKTAPFVAVSQESDLTTASERLGFPFILKTRRLGYDGKGQLIVRSSEELNAAWTKLGPTDLIAEGFVRFSREVSIIAVRSETGAFAFYPLCENTHVNGVLSKTVVNPEIVASPKQKEAEALAQLAMEKLGYVGVLVIELFDTQDGLVVNEMAPRVHNSGHWSIEGAVSSQFENHLRAVCGLPLGSTKTYGYCGMLNILHTRPNVQELLKIEGLKLHWYAKEPRPGRKLGHVTFVASDVEQLQAQFTRAQALLS